MQGSLVTPVLIPLDTLREQIAQTVAAAKAYDVPDVCVRLGIQQAVEESDAQEAFNSKRLYVRRRILSWNEADLVDLATRVLREYPSEDLADTVSEMTVHAEHRVSPLVRRDVLKTLNPLASLFGELPLIDSLREVFGVSVIQDDPAELAGLLGRTSLHGQIVQHCLRNDDWSHEELLTQCGALTCSQTRFFALLTKLLHPMTRRDAEQVELATAVGEALRRDGFTVRQTGVESGYAIYGVIRAQAGVAGAMKNLIFASIGEKPELVFRDAVNNDVEIVKHADKVLVFDRPLASSGLLLWKDLRDWYAELQSISDPSSAKEQLFRRLRQAVLSARSAGEFAVFQGYYERYGSSLGDRLPALIPQVYLHYDPYTRRQRGDEQFLARQRMDFLLMLEQGVRIVIEIDGRHHYAVPDPLVSDRFIANAQRYAEMVAEDRRLRLMGYEVYRFGGHEFLDVDLEQRKVGPRAQQCVAEFFDRLLTKHCMR
ncbi:LytR C-terminal domain-containing protein [Burkholderia multivorans]|uniref:AbiJ-NTD3 domain-containing protein n=1 Tax=Burkholderia multivorans TaxID=87883 RepID=A0A8E2RTH1_9BURK|nr:LytR C-terminal domain-containing protein [Burkholderia multivorans]MCA8264511.1 LytR C-terminal domain-containing protein [Burkholderia multivorans]MCO1361159.1 LytR C-terminal domain-containing protein [Burkholderia multivorans]MCO1381931.1 LytR C-terminal domain-containing protein [Burkholderia multivorans]MCO1402071.1 LytR C-terminal domain-containing protein [Burkholderia multivorans]MCO1420929.1 LytR C-terminal domain-containing protein [Burkholderia multivorans]